MEIPIVYQLFSHNPKKIKLSDTHLPGSKEKSPYKFDFRSLSIATVPVHCTPRLKGNMPGAVQMRENNITLW